MLDARAYLLVLWAVVGASMSSTPIPYNNSIGGTRLRKMPNPYVVVITLTDHWAQYPQPDCVGVYVGGYGSPDVSLVLTSPWCITIPEPDDPSWIPQEVRNAVNEITGSEPFTLHYHLTPDEIPAFDDDFHIGALQMSLPVGYWVPDIADMILNKREFRRRLDAGSDNLTYGFALGVNANPIKVFVVSWSQENCALRYKESKLPNWPEELRDGWFCVFRGRHRVSNVTIGRHVYGVDVGVPCDDAMGSPVLIGDFSKVLGIILKTYCDGDRSVAFAMSPAFLPEIVPPPKTTISTSTTEPPSHLPPPPLPSPPPYPRVPDPIATCSTTRIGSHLLLWSAVASFGFRGVC